MTRRLVGLAFVIAACAQIEPGDHDATSVGGHTAASPSPHSSGGTAGAVGTGGASGASGAGGAAGSGGASEDASEDATGEADALGEDAAFDGMDEATDAPAQADSAFVCVGDAAAATTCWFKVYGLCFDTLAAACDCLACPLEQCKATSVKKGRLNWGAVKDPPTKYGTYAIDSSASVPDASSDAPIEDAPAEADSGDALGDALVDGAADAGKDAAPTVQMNVTCAPPASGDAALE